MLTTLLFAKKYWKQLLAVAALLIVVFYVKGLIEDYGQRQYEKGKADSDKAWTAEWNERVEKHNEAVDKLKEDSKKAKKDLEEESKQREARLKKIIEDLKKRNPGRSDWIPGKGTVCTEPVNPGKPGTPTVEPVSKPLYDPADGLLTVPLGVTFVDTWNKITLEGFNSKPSTVLEIPVHIN
jgi:hypothetical protein